MAAPFLQPFVAQVADAEPLSLLAQFGFSGVIAFLHWWAVAKTIPSISDKHKEGMTAVASEVKGLRGDLQANMQEQLQILKDKK